MEEKLGCIAVEKDGEIVAEKYSEYCLDPRAHWQITLF